MYSVHTCTPTSKCKCKLCMCNIKYMCGKKSCSHMDYTEQLLGFFRVRLLCAIAPANAGDPEGVRTVGQQKLVQGYSRTAKTSARIQ